MTDASASLLAMGGPFDIIIADPPWRFKSNSAAKPGRNALGHYDCMELAEIKGLPVSEIAARDAALFLWVTVPFLDAGLDTLRAWGFTYKSELMWKKDRIGTGFWARNRHEVVLIGRRGKFPVRPLDEDGKMAPVPFPDSVIEGQQREHSRKPDKLHEQIDAVPQWRPLTARLEMFARESRPGWSAWGNESTKFDPVDVGALLDGSPEPEIEELLS